MDYQLIRLTAEWDESFRDIRLAALKESPHNFASTYECEAEWPLERFTERLQQNHTYGAIVDGKLVATAMLHASPVAAYAHKAFISAVYVLPDYRGKGIMRGLFTHLLKEAQGVYENIILALDGENEGALALYESLGFEVYGREPLATKYPDGSYGDDVWMIKRLV